MSKTSYWFCPNCIEEIDPANVTFQELHDACGHAVEWIEEIDLDRLREICEAEREGRIVELPCKAGDKIWILESAYEYDENPRSLIHRGYNIIECEVTNVLITENKKKKRTQKIRAYALKNGKTSDEQYNISFSEFGTTAFSTREEAEAAQEKGE